MEVVIFIGLPGAGKTTFYRARFAATHAHISKDRFPHNRRPARRQETLMREALGAGRSVVVDNTNPTRDSRAAAIAVGRECGARVVAYVFDVPAEVCRVRNAARGERKRVPDVAIWKIRKRLELPTIEEGFHELHVVKPVEGGKFQVLSVAEAGRADESKGKPRCGGDCLGGV